jgi:hypothetical protein
MTRYADRLEAAGIRVAVDERDINPPCVLINHPSLRYRFGKGGWSGEWSMWAIVPDSGRRVALDNLDDLMGAVQQALSGLILTATPISVAGVDGSPPLPGYDLVWTETIR